MVRMVKKLYKWCNYYNCWCKEAVEVTDGEGDCSYECNKCDEAKDIQPKE